MVNEINKYDTEYIIPYGQTEVNEDEFSHCRDLEKLYVPSYVAKIDEKTLLKEIPKRYLYTIISFVWQFAGRKAHMLNLARVV